MKACLEGLIFDCFIYPHGLPSSTRSLTGCCLKATKDRTFELYTAAVAPSFLESTSLQPTVLLVIFPSSCGLFNSCYCWSRVLRRRKGAHIPLNDFELCFCLFISIRIRGLKIMRWGEKREEEKNGTEQKDNLASKATTPSTGMVRYA